MALNRFVQKSAKSFIALVTQANSRGFAVAAARAA